MFNYPGKNWKSESPTFTLILDTIQIQDQIPNPYSLLIYIPALPQIARKRPNLAPPLYFCAQARYLRALGLRRGLRRTQNLQCCHETPRRRLNGDPGVPKCAPRLPKVFQRGQKGPQKRDKRSAMRSPEHALAFQSAFKGVLYTPKLPINRTSGHYVTNICCGIISTVTIRIIIIIISTDTITITLLSLLLYYYWWGVVGVGLSRPPPGAAPPPRSMHTTVVV